MEQHPTEVWIAACAHRLQLHWRTVDPSELEAVAGEIWRDPRLREMEPDNSAAAWLLPVASGHVHPIHQP
ncbi:hypothetical protein [Polaromonas sp.]|uniref:hypothetical protein n=1 Tax=Polaromonas sp. TaxID=1869339 RepID=UPI00352ABC53